MRLGCRAGHAAVSGWRVERSDRGGGLLWIGSDTGWARARWVGAGGWRRRCCARCRLLWRWRCGRRGGPRGRRLISRGALSLRRRRLRRRRLRLILRGRRRGCMRRFMRGRLFWAGTIPVTRRSSSISIRSGMWVPVAIMARRGRTSPAAVLRLSPIRFRSPGRGAAMCGCGPSIPAGPVAMPLPLLMRRRRRRGLGRR